MMKCGNTCTNKKLTSSQLREKILEFAVVLPAPSPYRSVSIPSLYTQR